jgi:hypothetical protein
LVALKKEREKEKRKKKERSNQVLLREFSKFPNKGRYVIPKGARVEVDPHHLSPLISFSITIILSLISFPSFTCTYDLIVCLVPLDPRFNYAIYANEF